VAEDDAANRRRRALFKGGDKPKQPPQPEVKANGAGAAKHEATAPKRYVIDDDLRQAVSGHETEVLNALGIAWNSRHQHITCPYPDHPDKHPSWRWHKGLAKAFCTCSQGDGIVRVTMKVEGLDFLQAKVRIAEALHRDDLIRTTGERDPLWFLHPGSATRDNTLPRAYLAYRLGVPAAEVLMPATPTAGWSSFGYYDGDLDRKIGEYPAAIFGLVNPEGRVHAHRIYLAPRGEGKAQLPPYEDGKPRDPKKAMSLPEGERIDRRCAFCATAEEGERSKTRSATRRLPRRHQRCDR
jgi:hypothetical protein